MIRHARRPRFGGYVAAAGAAYWINELNTGHIQRTDFVTALIAGARGPGGSAADAQYIANREAVGAHFALTQGLTDVAWARTVEAGVNDTAASVTAANAQTDAFAATAATAKAPSWSCRSWATCPSAARGRGPLLFRSATPAP